MGTAATTTSFDDTGLTPESPYRYRVAAVSGQETSEFTADVTVTTPAAQTPTVEITTDITTSTTWTADKIYILKGFIHVANGATLTIQPGTRIVGDFNTVGSSLFVLRGAQDRRPGHRGRARSSSPRRAPTASARRGDWGGLILVGNGIINRAAPIILEGTGTGATNPPVDYAGGNRQRRQQRHPPLRPGRVRRLRDRDRRRAQHLHLRGGGQRHRALAYLQALNGLDDSFEFFGGAVDADHLVSYNAGDDHFDMSEGYVGRLQYLIAYQSRAVDPRPVAGNISSDPQGIENDGCNGANCTNGQNSEPYTVPMVANATLVGPPATVTNSAGNVGMMLRRGTAGHLCEHRRFPLGPRRHQPPRPVDAGPDHRRDGWISRTS